MSTSPKKKKVSKRKITRKEVRETNYNFDNFEKYVKQEADRTGRSPEKIIEEVFKDGYLIWSVEESATIGGGVTQATPVLTAWAMPQDANDVDEMRRLRKEFAPVARGVDYLRTMIMGNILDVMIDDPEDKNKVDLKEEIKDFMKTVYQDQYLTSLYSLLSILLDEALTVGAAGAEIRYNIDPYPSFWDYVKGVQKSTLPVAKSATGGKDFVYYESIEPDWNNFKSIVQLKIIKNSLGRMKLYRDPRTWEANYWTLDEIVSSGDTAMAIHQLTLKQDSGVAIRFHPWQVFWLNVNRREFDERGISVIEPVRKTAILLEKILNSVGEGIYRAGNKKYFIVCGTEKRPWSKPHIRNVMQQIQEMGKRNWTNIPVPYGFDIKEIGGTVFEADAVTTKLMEILAQGMHVPLGVVALARQTPEGQKEQSMATFNEIERMRHEFKQAIEQQLFKKQLWCKHGKTRQKQGGATAPMYVPELEQSTKGLLNPIDRLETIVKILNVANPVDPQTKLALDTELAKILGYDEVKMKTQEDLRKELKVIDEQKKEMAKVQLENAKTAGEETKQPPEKKQGEPEPPSLAKQQKRLESGVSTSKKGQSKPMGGPRIPVESKGVIHETWNMAFEDFEHRIRRVQMYKQQQLTHNQIDEIFIQEAQVQEIEIAQHPQHIVPSKEYKDESSQKTGGNYGAQGYHTVVIGKGSARKIQVKTDNEEFITSFVNPLSQKEVEVVKVQLADGIAGYSKDGSKIYIDEAVPNWMYLGLITHELFEMTLMLTLGFKYKWAHIQATEVEKETVENLGIDWEKYDAEYKRINSDVVAKRDPKPKNPSNIMESRKRGKGGSVGMDSTRTGHMAQEDMNKPPMGRSDVSKTHETVPQPPQEVHITLETKTQPQEIKVITESKPLEINLKQTETQSQLNEIMSDMAKNKSAFYERKIALTEKQQELAIEENKQKKDKIESEIKVLETSIKESEATVSEIEARKKVVEEQIKTEQEKQTTEKKKQDVIKDIDEKVKKL